MKTVDEEFLTLHKKQDSLTWESEIDENMYHFEFISSFEACIYVQCFFDVVRNQTSNKT